MGRKQAQAFLAALIAWPVWAQEYNPALIPPQIIGSPTTMTAIDGGDDSTRLVNLGFPFEYYGQTFTQAWVSTNGFVSFYGPANLCCNGQPIEQAQRNTIYGYWTDLISQGNPYYRTDSNVSLFGWYNTYEYGTANQVTFEIGLFPDGKIQFNYGSLANTYHMVTAGITGPTSVDNVSLFHGQNVQFLQNQSGILSLTPQEPEPEPEPVFNPVEIAPSVAPDPVSESVVEAVQEEIVQETPAVVEEAIQEAVEEAVTETEVVAETVEEVVAENEAIVETEEEAEDAREEERLSPDELEALAGGGADAGSVSDGPTDAEAANALQNASESAQEAEEARQATQGPSGSNGSVIASNGSSGRDDSNVQFFQKEAIEDADTFSRETVLAVSVQNVAFAAEADAQYNKLNGEQTTTEAQEGAYTLSVVDGSTFGAPPVTGMVTDTTSPSSQTQQMELLNMAGMQGDMSAGAPTDIGDIGSEDAATMAQLAAIPEGYGAYTQARIPDMPFYQPRDIYRGRRIPDASMALYQMMKGNDATWTEMVESQYE